MTRPLAVRNDQLRTLREQDVARGVTSRLDDRLGFGVTEQPAAERDQRAQSFLRAADDRHRRRRDQIGQRRVAASSERSVDRRAHCFEIERLGERALHAERARHLAHFALVIGSGTEDHRGVRGPIVLAQPADQLVAVHPWHDDVGDQQVRLLGAQQVQCFHAVGRFEQAVLAAFEQQQQQLTRFRIVFRDENLAAHAFQKS